MVRVLISYLKFHYGTAFIEGYCFLRQHGLALGFIGIPLAIIWALIPVVIALLFLSGLYFIFLWNVL